MFFSEREALIRSVVADPHDDVPRLVVADWFEEHGEAERAEYIRLSITRERKNYLDPEAWILTSRMDCIARREWTNWRDELPRIPAVTWGGPERGFIGEARILETSALSRSADALFAVAPITRLAGVLLEDDTLLHCRYLSQIRTLDFSGPGDLAERRLLPLAEHEDLANLRSLMIANGGHGDSLLSHLAQCRGWPRLDSLHLGDNRFEPAGLFALACSPLMSQIRHFSMNGCRIGDRGIREWVRAPDLYRIHTLDVGDNQLSFAGLRRLLDRSWPELEYLNLAFNDIGAIGLQDLARTDRLPQLTALDLTGNQQIGDGGISSLAQSDRLLRLKSVRLGYCRFTRKGLAALLCAPWLSGLARLDLREFRLQVEGARMFANAPFHSLRYLELPACPLGDAELLTLLEAPWVAGLTHLILHHNSIGAEGAAALADHPALDRLVHLDLSRNPIPPESIARLRERFGDWLIE